MLEARDVASRGVGIWWAALVALVSSAGVAGAQESAVARPGLNWVRLEGADDCLSAAELADKVEVRVGRTLFVAATEAELFVDGYVRGVAQPDGTARNFDVKLQVSRPGGEVLGERVLSIEGEGCSAIEDAVSLVIAVTLYPRSSLVTAGIPLDPSTAQSLSTLFGDEPTDPDPTTLPAAAASTDIAPEGAPHRSELVQGKSGTGTVGPTWLGIDVIGAGALGQLPGVRFGLGGYLRITPRGLWPIELGGAHYFVASESVAEGGAVDFQLTTGSLTGCPWDLYAAELRGCAGLEGGVIRAIPRDLAVTGSATSDPVLNLLLGLVYRPRVVGQLHLRIALLAAVPVVQHEFAYRAQDGSFPTLFQTSPIHGRADLGLGLSF
jgi:hypothetical protein